MPMCTNLSKDILDSQSSLGKAEPGRQNKIVKKMSAAIGKTNLRYVAMEKEKSGYKILISFRT